MKPEPGEVSVGFYGKLPQLGDFVGRRVSERLVGLWDDWMQESLQRSRDAGGPQWLDLYLTGPMWRFVAARDILDDVTVAGVMFPSVDRVGRCFPFTVFATLPRAAQALAVASQCADWYERIEDLVLAQFEDDARDLDALDQALIALAPRLDALLLPSIAGNRDCPTALEEGVDLLHMPLGSRPDVGAAAVDWLDDILRAREPRVVHWWTSGSSQVKPSWLITRGLPPPAAFGAMLTGRWHDWPWNSCAVATAADSTPPAPTVQMSSAGSTHQGNVRSENQDAWMARPEVGLWAVADGMGGHEQGGLASRLTRDALNNIAPASRLDELIGAVRGALQDANRCLYDMSVRPTNPVMSGSTVVTLLVRANDGACLWAGDSRLYRLRAGRLEQLTVDHSDDSEGSNVITRAVGGHEGIELDERTFSVVAGDRFLLCSDGLYREISEREIADLLGKGGALDAVQALQQRVLRGDASDNVTIVVADARPVAA